jgi:hypothetical protein
MKKYDFEKWSAKVCKYFVLTRSIDNVTSGYDLVVCRLLVHKSEVSADYQNFVRLGV